MFMIQVKINAFFCQVVDKQKNITEIPEWFRGCRLNFAENILRFNDDRVAVYATGNFDYISFT